MVIMTRNSIDVTKLLNTWKEFLKNWVWLSLYQSVKHTKIYYSVDPELIIDGEEVPYLQIHEVTKYLGARVSF